MFALSLWFEKHYDSASRADQDIYDGFKFIKSLVSGPRYVFQILKTYDAI